MKIGIVDTTFAKINMGPIAINKIKENFEGIEIIRKTVPGIKDLAVECKILLEKENCDVSIALGMPGPEKIDEQCAHEASLGIMYAKLLTNKHILEVFVHENEAQTPEELHSICKNRTEKHALNAVRLIQNPGWFIERAGTGLRQGKDDVGQLKVGK